MATYKLVDSDKLDAAMTATADAIREKTGSTDPIAWDSEKGMSEAVEPVFEAGKKSEYDAFWDAFQKNGDICDYSRTFSGTWTVEIFKPKYNIISSSAYMMFCASRMRIDLQKHLEELGVCLDLSPATNTQYMFQNCEFTRIGVIDVRGSANNVPLDTAFANSYYLVTIDRIYLKRGKIGEAHTGTFINCSSLENVSFDGEITEDGLDMRWSNKLSKNSILSAINVLSVSSNGKTATFSLTAVNTAFETTAGAADGSTSDEWAALIATKPNWTIALADA